MGTRWTTERDDQLRMMRAAGMTCSQIADKFGCTRNAVMGRSHRLGIVGAPRPKAEGGRPPGPRRKPRSFVAPAAFNPEPGIPFALPPELPRRPGERCTIFEVTGCRWPYGDPMSPDFSFCNDHRVEGLPYCEAHCAVAYSRSRSDA